MKMPTLTTGSYKKALDCVIAEGHTWNKDNHLSIDGLSLSGMSFKFGWQKIKKSEKKNTKESAYAWLNPIRV